ncbi:MAG: chemotaxis protein CheW [Anaeromyxobacter sp.]
MPSLPAERKVVVFSAGGVRFALRLSHVREIAAVAPGEGEVLSRGERVETAFVSTVLGLPAGPSGFALLTEGTPPVALRVDAVHGISDLSEVAFFQLPAPTPLPQPAPFAGVMVVKGEIALELAVSSLGFAPIVPADEHTAEPPPDLGLVPDRELRFARAGRVFGVPLSLLVQVLENPRLAPVPLTPHHHRGLLHHARALHAVIDVGVLYGDAPPFDVVEPGRPGSTGTPRTVLLIDAGGTGVGVVADRVLGLAEGDAEVLRPPWDALFGA